VGKDGEPAPGLRELLGEALGRTNIRFVATPKGNRPTSFSLGQAPAANAEVSGAGKSAVVIAFATGRDRASLE